MVGILIRQPEPLFEPPVLRSFASCETASSDAAAFSGFDCFLCSPSKNNTEPRGPNVVRGPTSKAQDTKGWGKRDGRQNAADRGPVTGRYERSEDLADPVGSAAALVCACSCLESTKMSANESKRSHREDASTPRSRTVEQDDLTKILQVTSETGCNRRLATWSIRNSGQSNPGFHLNRHSSCARPVEENRITSTLDSTISSRSSSSKAAPSNMSRYLLCKKNEQQVLRAVFQMFPTGFHCNIGIFALGTQVGLLDPLLITSGNAER